jgi:hypothetical protein
LYFLPLPQGHSSFLPILYISFSHVLHQRLLDVADDCTLLPRHPP